MAGPKDQRELSSTVAAVLATPPQVVSATELAREIIGRHPDYGRRVRERLLPNPSGSTRKDKQEWLAEVRALYDHQAAPLLHGRLVVIGLAHLDQALRAALDANGLYTALVGELAEPLATLWARADPDAPEPTTPDPTLPDPTPPDPTPPDPTFPDPAEEPELTGGISADLVNPDQGIPRKEDDLQVWTYVAMMATAVARTDTKLPLSIGLFGEWGSGKSYFMGLLRQQIRELATSGDPAYDSGIVQIGFNAWTYADSNLWASLGDEIFRQLAGPIEREDGDDDRERREQLRERMRTEQGRAKELEAAKDTATAEVAHLRAELHQRKPDRRQAAVTLLHATFQAVQADQRMSGELSSAFGKLGVTKELDQARLLADAVTDSRDAVAGARRAADHRNRRYLVAAAVAVGLFEVGLVLAGSASRLLTGTGLATLLAAGAAFATVSRRVAEGVRSLETMAGQIRQRTELGEQKEIETAVEAVRKAEAREEVLQAQLEQVVARVGELGRELVEISPGQRLYTFLAERAASDEYRRQQGLVASIRRDFTRLARLQKQWRSDSSGSSPRPIDRIVLYIDDLDRCTPHQVVEVLQAVHLLLATDLFVVVVGVDPRWLLHSLRDQYRSTLTPPTSHAAIADPAEAGTLVRPRGADDEAVQEDLDRLMLSTPYDYLEKIFNVPFVLPAMTPTGFRAMVRRLAATEADSITGAGDPVTAGTVPQNQEPGGEEIAARAGGPVPPVQTGSELDAVRRGTTVKPTPLTEPELTILSELAPLVRSPRETKRLLNLYRMLRSTKDLSGSSRFLGADGAPGEFQAVAVLLGLLSADPHRLGQILFTPPDADHELLGGICHRTGPGTWPAFLAGIRPRRVAEEWRNDLHLGLSDQEQAQWARLAERARPASALVTLPDLRAFTTWSAHVVRFSFLCAAPTNSVDQPPILPAQAAAESRPPR